MRLNAVVLIALVMGVSANQFYSIRNERVNVTVCRTAQNAVYVSGLNFYMPAEDLWTANILGPDPVPEPPADQSSSTAILAEGNFYVPWSTTATTVVANSSAVVVTGLKLGEQSSPIAEEDWTFVLSNDGTGFDWLVTRRFLSEVVVSADRVALTLATVAIPPVWGSQVPSFLDLDLFMNTTANTGFNLWGNNSEDWYEFVSPNTNQSILLGPSGIELDSMMTSDSGPAFFSFAKPPWDGTAAIVAIGLQSLDRRLPPVERQAGQQQYLTWSLRVKPEAPPGTGSPYATLNLTLPAALQSLSDQIQMFARVQNMWMGFIFGNNPASVPCLHEAGWFPWIQSIFMANASSHLAMQKELEFFAATAVNASGYVMPRWASNGYYYVEWGPLIDQVPHMLIAFHSMASIMEDGASWLKTVEPALDLMAQYLLVNGLNTTASNNAPWGTFITRGSGLADAGLHASNWYDIIEFGHADAYIDAYCVIAIGAVAEMKKLLGKHAEADAYALVHGTAIGAFNTAFWNDTLGFYYDWIDVDGNARQYFYTDHNMLAISFGMASPGQAKRILENLDAGYERLCKNFNLTRDDIWAMPCNMFPIVNPKDVTHEMLGKFPGYENGGSFFHSVGLEVLARATADHGDDALNAFTQFMENGFAVNRGWAQQLYWSTKTLVGTDPLNDSLLTLWGFVRGVLGVKADLLELTLSTNKVPAALEGTRYVFGWHGKDHCVEVVDRHTRFCKKD